MQVEGRIQPTPKTMALWQQLFPLKAELVECKDTERRIELRAAIAKLGEQILRETRGE